MYALHILHSAGSLSISVRHTSDSILDASGMPGTDRSELGSLVTIEYKINILFNT